MLAAVPAPAPTPAGEERRDTATLLSGGGTGRVTLEGPGLSILVDASKQLRIEDVAAGPKSDAFQPAPKGIPNFGFTDAAVWYRFTLHNRLREPMRTYVEFDNAHLGDVELFIPDDSGSYAHRKTGRSLAFNSRDIEHENFVFLVQLSPGARINVYTRVHTETAHVVPIVIWADKGFPTHVHDEQLAFGFYYGIVAVLFLYNLFLFITLRDRSYFYYLICVATIALVQLVYDGYAQHYLWPFHPAWGLRIFVVSFALALFAAALYASEFLGLKEANTGLQIAARGYAGVALLSAVLGFVLPYEAAIKLDTAVLVFLFPLLLAAGVTRWRQGFTPARLFTIGWGSLTVGIVLFLLRNAGVLPTNFVTAHLLQISTAVLLVLNSLAVADRINEGKLRADDAQKTAFEALKRTGRIKDEFLAQASNELRGPIEGMVGLAELVRDGAAGEVSAQQSAALATLIATGKRVGRLVGELMTFEKLRGSTMSIVKRSTDLHQITEQVLALARPFVGDKDIRLKNDVPENFPSLDADPDRLQQILFNLVEHGVRSTEAGSVLVAANASSDFIEVTVADSGIGIPKEELDSLFKPFFDQPENASAEARSRGLSLSIVAKLVELHGGTIRVTSKVGRGTAFKFTIPALPPPPQKPSSGFQSAKSSLSKLLVG